MTYLLSVDGGGTKTQFCICDLEGNQKAMYFAGSSNYKSVGVKEAYSSFQEGMKQIKEGMGISGQDIAYSVWGISGCDSDNDYGVIAEQVARLGFAKEQFYLCNDALLAYYAQAYAPGIVIIAGTGSIVLGVNERGEIHRCGGWGYNISDMGSGYWIGSEAVKHTLLYCDGCLEYSPLFDAVRDFFEAEDFESLPYIVTEITDYFEMAKAAQVVVELSKKGEALSRKILMDGAKSLAQLVKSVYGRLGFHENTKFSIVLSGGVLKSGEYQEIVKEALNRQIPLHGTSFFIQKNPPVWGGIQLARKALLKNRV